jgi:hypothetical protein
MKHAVVFVVLAAAIAYFGLKKSAVDKLMVPVTQYTAEQAGNRFVDIDPALLPVSPAYFAVPGVTTVVYFHDETCHGCVSMDRNISDFVRIRPDVAVRKVRISLNGNAYYNAIKDFKWKIFVMPCILVFDRDGTLIAGDERTDVAGSDLLEEWMAREAEKAAKSKAL